MVRIDLNDLFKFLPLKKSTFLLVVHRLFGPDKFISDRELQSLYAQENNTIHKSQICINTLKSMFISNDKEDDNSNSDLCEELLRFKPHKPRFVAPLCHVTASSASDDLLIIHTPTENSFFFKH